MTRWKKHPRSHSAGRRVRFVIGEVRFVILLFALFGVCVAAQDPTAGAGKQAEPADVAAGRAQFKQTCAFCHGANARGASGPDLIRSGLVSHDKDADLIGPVIRNGRPDKGMPAFSFSDEQIHAVAAFLHNEARLAYSVYTRGPGDYALEKLLVGNAEAGKQYFDGAGKCSGCHSVTGDMAHVATKYKPIDLQSRIVYPRGALPAVTVTDSSGKRYSGSETYSDEFTITLRDHDGWIRSWSKADVKFEVQDPLAAHVALLSTYTDKNIHDLFAYLETLK